MVYRHYVDISVAVATPKGLVVPVLRYQIKKRLKIRMSYEFQKCGIHGLRSDRTGIGGARGEGRKFLTFIYLLSKLA